jgi:Flp pilus assembly protein TadG
MVCAALRVLGRLPGNSRGNVAAIIAASLIPIAAIIGSGLDMSRAYMAQQKLQQACDAGSLAGRRTMTGGALDTTSRAEATKFFNFNFPQGAFQTATFTPTITAPDTTTVRIQASTTIPVTIMKLFGYTTLPLSVDCKAAMNYVNTDIMLVLDNTGSMNCTPGSSSTCSSSSEVSGSKMQGMRDAVMALYDQLASTQTTLEAQGLRLRYGIVPYSSVVNVGKDIYAVNSAYINATSNYQQCIANCSSGTKTYGPVAVTHTTSWLTSTWSGCIEERGTINTIADGDSLTLPSGSAAYDLDLDVMPTNTATRWSPWDSTAQQADTGGDPACNASQRIKRLQAWTRANLLTYMNALRAEGGTMSDIGVIWGGHLISSGGAFAGDNPTVYPAGSITPVNKFMIVMTDGTVTAYKGYYGAYGVENYDHRIEATYPCSSSLGNGSECLSDSHVHRQRFSMACNIIKGKNVSIWVIGFGQSFSGAASSDDTDALSGCASNASQAAYISDSATLIQQFQIIGQNIGQLRLTQ